MPLIVLTNPNLRTHRPLFFSLALLFSLISFLPSFLSRSSHSHSISHHTRQSSKYINFAANMTTAIITATLAHSSSQDWSSSFPSQVVVEDGVDDNVNCENLGTMISKSPQHILCAVASTCDSDGYVNYLEIIYCNFLPLHRLSLSSSSSSFGFSWLGKLAFIFSLLLYSFILFYSLARTADAYFSVSLAKLVDTLGISPEIAGVTFLALGNGAPDITAIFASVLFYNTISTKSEFTFPQSPRVSGRHFSLALGDVLGGGMFVTTIVAGLCLWFVINDLELANRAASTTAAVAATATPAPPRKMRLSPVMFGRDIGFYLVGVITLVLVLADNVVRWYEAIVLVTLYLTYVALVFAVDHCQRVYSNTKFIYSRKQFSHDPDTVSNCQSLNLSALEESYHDQRHADVTTPKSALCSQQAQSKARVEDPLVPKDPYDMSHPKDSKNAPKLALMTKNASSPYKFRKSNGEKISYETENMKNIKSINKLLDSINTLRTANTLVDEDPQLSELAKEMQTQSFDSGEITRWLNSPNQPDLPPNEATSLNSSRRHVKYSMEDIYDDVEPDHFGTFHFHRMESAPGQFTMLAQTRRKVFFESEFMWSVKHEDEQKKSADDLHSQSIHRTQTCTPSPTYNRLISIIHFVYLGLTASPKFALEATLPLQEIPCDRRDDCLGQRAGLAWFQTETSDVCYHDWDSWSFFFSLLSPFLSPFILFASHDGLDYGFFAFNIFIPFWVVAVVLGGLVLTIFRVKPVLDPPFYGFVRDIWSFTISLCWLNLIANELVSLLNSLGNVFGIPASVLGLTILTWGNSMGDLIANVAIAREGEPRMALAACYAGPCFNMLFGLGLALVVACFENFPHPYRADIEPSAKFTALVLIISLVITLVWISANRFHVTKRTCYLLFSVYFCFMSMTLMDEIAKIVSS